MPSEEPEFDVNYMIASLGFRKELPKRPVNQDTIRSALLAFQSILEHRISPSTRNLIKKSSGHARRWLKDSGDTPPGDILSGFVTQMIDTYFTLCHPEIHMIEKISRIARKAAQLADDYPDFSPLYSMLFEYVDVMVPISKVLKCKKCFGPNAYNISLPVVDNGTFWIKVKQCLLLNEKNRNQLPLNYIPMDRHRLHDRASQMPPGESSRIKSWLARVCSIVGWEIKDIEWQIINYADFHESPCGPRMFFRTGRWSHLAKHTLQIREQVDDLKHTSGRDSDFSSEVGPYASRVVDLVEKKWFRTLSVTGSYEFSDVALSSMERSRRGEYNYTPSVCRDFRQRQLFDPAELIVTEPLMVSRPFRYGRQQRGSQRARKRRAK
ncbi:TPA_exp: Uncharacterized protein A8136_6762 [Trichophyton benhamiae CBS 112371]|uniref:Uncharacterized protein n=1 Tax=Arthroderma benhamiae (strain ATCC MYA-4681 / CBS 112371) TaxID=663331 RepID=D4ARU8_ARTBC|nr:uncharacterized protein ARB_06962 [Trichophyton benhamiae CBS 112371]EFE34012.1 hypothetical protein ARB_06962 [Trichophyton benhamiae CBS 112371]DAA76996.1 TPA_exp: Uncharacterized protein A8136_6762 [Trichophyton benhamiae CBS 112371]